MERGWQAGGPEQGAPFVGAPTEPRFFHTRWEAEREGWPSVLALTRSYTLWTQVQKLGGLPLVSTTEDTLEDQASTLVSQHMSSSVHYANTFVKHQVCKPLRDSSKSDTSCNSPFTCKFWAPGADHITYTTKHHQALLKHCFNALDQVTCPYAKCSLGSSDLLAGQVTTVLK